jgi:hypothetical protein
MVVVDLVVTLPAETHQFLRHLELSPLAEVEVVQDISTSVQVMVVQEL